MVCLADPIDPAMEACLVQAVQMWSVLLPKPEKPTFRFTFPAAGGFGQLRGRSAMLAFIGESMLRHASKHHEREDLLLGGCCCCCVPWSWH